MSWRVPSKVSKFDEGKEKTQKSKVARFTIGEYELVLDQQERILAVKNSANTNFVNIILEKPFYRRTRAPRLSTGGEICMHENTFYGCMPIWPVYSNGIDMFDFAVNSTNLNDLGHINRPLNHHVKLSRSDFNFSLRLLLLSATFLKALGIVASRDFDRSATSK